MMPPAVRLVGQKHPAVSSLEHPEIAVTVAESCTPCVALLLGSCISSSNSKRCRRAHSARSFQLTTRAADAPLSRTTQTRPRSPGSSLALHADWKRGCGFAGHTARKQGCTAASIRSMRSSQWSSRAGARVRCPKTRLHNKGLPARNAAASCPRTQHRLVHDSETLQA
jgi:hypothetical protein